MLTLALTVKLLTEIALLSLVGQGVVGLLSGQARLRNPVYRLFKLISQPWVRAARWVCPRIVLDRHMPLVAVFLLLLLWAAAAIAKVSICMQVGAALCK
ncbi:MAG: hypothetical protein EAZ34_03865 [Polaromonas sp.]|nr:MAG: hypothetical protein EAZ34_03865 [Polaromonas sp.]